MYNLIVVVGLIATLTSVSLLLPTVVKQYMYGGSYVIQPLICWQSLISSAVWTLYAVLRGDLCVCASSIISLSVAATSLYLHYTSVRDIAAHMQSKIL